MQKQSKPARKVLFALVLIVLVFLGWSALLQPDPNISPTANAQKVTGNLPLPQELVESNAPAPVDIKPEAATLATVPATAVAVGAPSRVNVAQPPGTDPHRQALEYKTLNEDQQLNYAINDLAEQLAIPVDAVHSQKLQRVTWRSSATGCPKPGRSYMQVLVPGVLIQLQANGTNYRYHANTGGRPFNCPIGQAESPSPSADGALE